MPSSWSPTPSMKSNQYSEQEVQKFIEEAFDDTKVLLVCGKHQYTGDKKKMPAPGCKDCWFVYFLRDIASVPPHMREQRLAELEEVIHHTVESVQRGEFDFTPDQRPSITIEKDAE